MAVCVTVVAVFAVALSFAEGNVISRRQSLTDCSNVTLDVDRTSLLRCGRSLGAVWLLAGRPNVLDQIRGHLSNLCAPPCIDLLRQNFANCGPPDLSNTDVDGALSFYCGSGPGGVPCLSHVFQERGRNLTENIDNACAAPESSANCSSPCSSALDSLVEYNGCCLGSQIAFQRASNTIDPGPPSTFGACNVPVPEVCGSTITDTVSGESGLHPVIALVILAGLLVASLL